MNHKLTWIRYVPILAALALCTPLPTAHAATQPTSAPSVSKPNVTATPPDGAKPHRPIPELGSEPIASFDPVPRIDLQFNNEIRRRTDEFIADNAVSVAIDSSAAWSDTGIITLDIEVSGEFTAGDETRPLPTAPARPAGPMSDTWCVPTADQIKRPLEWSEPLVRTLVDAVHAFVQQEQPARLFSPATEIVTTVRFPNQHMTVWFVGTRATMAGPSGRGPWLLTRSERPYLGGVIEARVIIPPRPKDATARSRIIGHVRYKNTSSNRQRIDANGTDPWIEFEQNGVRVRPLDLSGHNLSCVSQVSDLVLEPGEEGEMQFNLEAAVCFREAQLAGCQLSSDQPIRVVPVPSPWNNFDVKVIDTPDAEVLLQASPRGE